VIAAAAIYALAALALPELVRGRPPVIDGLGALVWAAGLISAFRLIGGDPTPPGLIFGALLAAGGATLLARRATPWAPLATPAASEEPLGVSRLIEGRSEA
jgi:hypothetical protein